MPYLRHYECHVAYLDVIVLEAIKRKLICIIHNTNDGNSSAMLLAPIHPTWLLIEMSTWVTKWRCWAPILVLQCGYRPVWFWG